MKHILFKLEGCPFSILNNEKYIKFCLFHAAEASHSKVIKIETQKFVPQGVTGFALLAESHLSIHTWPEKGIAMCDIFTCGDGCEPELAVKYLSKWLSSTNTKSQYYERH
tara:strand:- start:153 stop:482 length:330 start_codon:yes stop_codon:yes gene_type:complete